MFSLDDVSVFITVVTQKNFSDAARTLKMSPSAVSKRIARLESELNAKLINRSSHGISLTSAGSTFFARCADIVPTVENAASEVRGLYNDSDPGGPLRIHASVGVGTKLIAPLLPAFLQNYPNISVTLITHSENFPLTAGGVDVFIRSRDVKVRDKSMKSRELGPCHYVISASPEYLARFGRPKHPRDLANHNCFRYIDRDRGSLLDNWPFREGKEVYTVKVTGSMVSNNSAAIFEALSRGFGVALLPFFAVMDDIRAGRLETLFREEIAHRRKMKAYYLGSKYPPPNVNIFLDFIQSHLHHLTF
jgi:DNA-binding transcriptional LysR family regulator